MGVKNAIKGPTAPPAMRAATTCHMSKESGTAPSYMHVSGPESKCRECTRPFNPTKSWQVFCSRLCRDTWHNKQRLPETKSPPLGTQNDSSTR